MSFELLLDELERLRDKRGNHMGGLLRKEQTLPVHRIAKVIRSEPVAFKNLMPRHRQDFSGELDDMISGMNKAMQHKPRAATLRLNKPRGTDLRKAMTDFNANMQKAMANGDLTCDEVCRLEAHRNRLLQRPLTGVI